MLLRLFTLLLLLAPAAYAKPKPVDHWVGTWAAAPMAFPATANTLGPEGTTFREIVHVSVSGPLVRVVFTNEFGTQPLTIAAAHIALPAKVPGDIVLASAHALTFSGSPSVTIPAGGLAASDPAALTLPALSDLAVSFFLPAQPLSTVSAHGFADQTGYTAPGNAVRLKTLPSATTITSWPFLKGVDVMLPATAASIVTFGDSITDGAASTQDANARWPDLLARRLHADKHTANLGVLNEGIGGNRVLHDNTGPSALARFDRDVLAQAGVKYVVIMEGINDIGQATNPTGAHDLVSAQEIIAGLGQLAARAHTQGIKVIGATLTPFVGAGYQSPAGETMRETVNNWIRTTPDLDGIIDFDRATRDPANPTVFLPTNDSGDHLHPSDTGYNTMANSIDLTLFTQNK